MGLSPVLVSYLHIVREARVATWEVVASSAGSAGLGGTGGSYVP